MSDEEERVIGHGLCFYVIYEHPTDYPEDYIVRRHWVTKGKITPEKEPMAVVKTLEEAHRRIPKGLYNLGRMTLDDPKIKEVWV